MMPDETTSPLCVVPPSVSSAPALVIVRAAVAPLHTEARVSSGQTSQALAGQLLMVHDESGDWLRVSGIDAYAAWVHRGYVVTAPRDTLVDIAVGVVAAPWAEPGTVGLRRAERGGAAESGRVGSLSLGCTVRSPTGVRALPLGALVQDGPPGSSGLPREVVESGLAVRFAERATRFPRAAAALARSAAELFVGTSYQWGGVTPWGADCSGFVQSVYRLHGVELPRDAWQQALDGEEVGAGIEELAPADLVFFSDRDDQRITHVGVALGGARMAHVSLGRGGFAVERLDDVRDPYVARLVRQRRAVRRVVL